MTLAEENMEKVERKKLLRTWVMLWLLLVVLAQLLFTSWV